MNERVLEDSHFGALVPRREFCPRCQARLVISYDESQCIYCGYVDYNYEPPTATTTKKSVVNTATLWVVRYEGDSPALAKAVSYIKVERNGYCIAYKVNCPYCRTTMSKSSRRSSKHIERREERHRCPNGHIVTLAWTKSGELSWK